MWRLWRTFFLASVYAASALQPTCFLRSTNALRGEEPGNRMKDEGFCLGSKRNNLVSDKMKRSPPKQRTPVPAYKTFFTPYIKARWLLWPLVAVPVDEGGVGDSLRFFYRPKNPVFLALFASPILVLFTYFPDGNLELYSSILIRSSGDIFRIIRPNVPRARYKDVVEQRPGERPFLMRRVEWA